MGKGVWEDIMSNLAGEDTMYNILYSAKFLQVFNFANQRNF